ncbi:MAG: hypothetical protein IPO81_30225 [Kouleothrix sp.]|nr:hypothetical protein [Kouleothrix sp.]
MRNPVAKWLDQLGVFGLRSYEKRVPQKVFEQPAEGIARFLRHLWATDGCIHFSQGAKHYARLPPQDTSELARDLQSQLLRLETNAVLALDRRALKAQYHAIVMQK